MLKLLWYVAAIILATGQYTSTTNILPQLQIQLIVARDGLTVIYSCDQSCEGFYPRWCLNNELASRIVSFTIEGKTLKFTPSSNDEAHNNFILYAVNPSDDDLLYCHNLSKAIPIQSNTGNVTSHLIIPYIKANDCPQLEVPMNGNITYKSEYGAIVDICGGFDVKTIASYSCEEGYQLVRGDNKRTCTMHDSGIVQWSGQAPVCELSRPIACYNLEPPLNGNATLDNDSREVGSTITYNCEEGYQLVRGDNNRTCTTHDGGTVQWSGQAPVCEPSISLTCYILEPPLNRCITFDKNSRENGTIVTYTCEEGYQLVRGDNNRTCTMYDDGTVQWSGQAPVCELSIPIACYNLEPPLNGNITLDNNSREIGSTITYSCEEDYQLVRGDNNRTCTMHDNGTVQWSGQAPVCEPPISLQDTVKFGAIGSSVSLSIVFIFLALFFILAIFIKRCKSSPLSKPQYMDGLAVSNGLTGSTK